MIEGRKSANIVDVEQFWVAIGGVKNIEVNHNPVDFSDNSNVVCVGKNCLRQRCSAGGPTGLKTAQLFGSYGTFNSWIPFLFE